MATWIVSSFVFVIYGIFAQNNILFPFGLLFQKIDLLEGYFLKYILGDLF